MLYLMVVDDEEDARDKMIRCIDNFQSGVTIVGTASDGFEAYEKIIELQPDIVLIDIKMPGITGLEVIRRVRAENQSIVFIIISSYSDFTYAREALHLNVEDYLLKPFLPADVYQAIYKAAEHIQTVNMLPMLSNAIQPQTTRKATAPSRMRCPIVYPFEEERLLQRTLQVGDTFKDAQDAYDVFRDRVHANNLSATAKINCYVILYVELHRLVMKLGGTFHSLEASIPQDARDPVGEIETTLSNLCQEIYTRLKGQRITGNFISSAVAYIEEFYAKDISLAEVANYVGISPSYLSNQFKLTLNTHFVDYVHAVRIHHAMELLKQPFLKGYEVGEMVGYNSNKYFSQSFRKVTGMTINQFRKNSGLSGTVE